MKFLGQHRSDLFRIMEKSNFHQNDFSYIKRKGRILIQTSKPQILFGYIRKKHTLLNPITKQWEHSNSYKIQSNTNPEFEVSNWSDVIDHFEKWLSLLVKQNP